MTLRAVPAAYDRRADEYVDLLGSVEQMVRQDRETIERWGAAISGPVLDAGCGPGHWSEHLRSRGAGSVVGLDGSVRFVDSARRRFPYVPFLLGDLARLPLATGSVGGVLAWYSVIHTPPCELDDVLREFSRVLRGGGSLLMGFFDGEPCSPFDHAVTTAYFWSGGALSERLAPHGLVVERVETRHDTGARPHGHLLAVRP